MKIREYAEQRGCSVQNVYLHLKKPEFEGLWKRGILSEEAIKILDSLINPPEISVVDTKNTEKIEKQDALIQKLYEENAELHRKLENSQEQNMVLLIEMQKSNQQLLEAKSELNNIKINQSELENLKEKVKIIDELQNMTNKMQEDLHNANIQVEIEKENNAKALEEKDILKHELNKVKQINKNNIEITKKEISSLQQQLEQLKNEKEELENQSFFQRLFRRKKTK